MKCKSESISSRSAYFNIIAVVGVAWIYGWQLPYFQHVLLFHTLPLFVVRDCTFLHITSVRCVKYTLSPKQIKIVRQDSETYFFFLLWLQLNCLITFFPQQPSLANQLIPCMPSECLLSNICFRGPQTPVLSNLPVMVFKVIIRNSRQSPQWGFTLFHHFWPWHWTSCIHSLCFVYECNQTHFQYKYWQKLRNSPLFVRKCL